MPSTPATLMYHDVVSADMDWSTTGFPGASAADYKVSEKDFEAHLLALASILLQPPGLVTDATFFSASSAPDRWMLTFDDGGDSAASTSAPLLKALGWRAHFLVTTSMIDKPGFLSTSEIKELVSQGHVIGAHSHSHPLRFASLPQAEMEEEWKRSCSILESIIGVPTTVGSVPGGLYSRNVGKAAGSAGVRWLFTSEPTTHPARVDDCEIIGRFAVRRHTSSSRIVKLVAGRSLARVQEIFIWKFKGVLKRIGGDFYLKIRERLFELRRH